MDDTTELGRLLDAIGWTTGRLAERLGVSDGTVQQWKRGHRQPRPSVLPWLRLVAAGVEAAGSRPPGWTEVRPGRRKSTV